MLQYKPPGHSAEYPLQLQRVVLRTKKAGEGGLIKQHAPSAPLDGTGFVPWLQLPCLLALSPDYQRSSVLGTSYGPELRDGAIRIALKRLRCAELAFGSGTDLDYRSGSTDFCFF
jgi:hypothetical protein